MPLPRSILLIFATSLVGCEPITTADPGPVGSAIVISAGAAQACAIQASGDLKCWGKAGLVGDGAGLTRATPVDVGGFSASVNAVVCGERHSCALTGEGRVFCWGSNADRGQLGPTKDGGSEPLIDAPRPHEIRFQVAGPATFLASGALHSCAIQPLGQVWCWGDNGQWRLSKAVGTEMSPAPTAVQEASGESVNGARGVAAGGAHTCIVSGNGDAQCWGSNDRGQLANGTIGGLAQSPFTVPLGGATVTAIAAGSSHTCALLSDGTVQCWGANGSGQLGNDMGVDAPLPVSPRLGGMKVVRLSAGGDATCVVTGDRALWCWGDNSFGQIGNGSELRQQPKPMKVSNLIGNIRDVSVGTTFTCAVTDVGKAYCWGHNADGQLGDGTLDPRNVPGAVKGL